MDKLIHRHDLDTEKLVLTSLVLDPSNFDSPEAVFPPDAFYSENHRKIYAAAQNVYHRTGCADLHLVAAQLAESGMKGALAHLMGIVTEGIVQDSMTFTSAYFPAYARRLRKVYVEREKGRAALQFQQAISDGQDENEARIMLDSILDALDAMDPPTIDSRDIAEMIGSAARFPTGIKPLDYSTKGGLTRPGLNIIAARPSVGKSALARVIIRNAAQAGTTVFWYSGDQSLSQIYELEIAHAKRSGQLRISEWEYEKRVKAVEHIKTQVWRDRVILIDDPLTLPQLTSLARASNAGLVVVDYLQIVDTGIRDESEYASVTRVSKALKALALEMNVPVVALAQISREVNPNEAPSLRHLKSSGQMEQDADQVWGLQRDTSVSSDEPQQATLHILKNKTGPTGRVPLSWIGDYASYEEWAHESRGAGYHYD